MQRSHSTGQVGSITCHYGTTHNTYLVLLLTASQTGSTQNKRVARLKAGRQTQIIYCHWLAASTFASAPCKQYALPFHFIRADK